MGNPLRTVRETNYGLSEMQIDAMWERHWKTIYNLPKGVTMFNRTFEVPQNPREVVKSCGNCSSIGGNTCHKDPAQRQVDITSYCEQHTINQDLFKDEMPEGEVAR